MKSSRKIDISKSSLVSLKAELSRKQEEVNKAKAQAQAHYIRPLPQPKKQTVWTKQNAGVSERGEKDIEEQAEEDDVLKKSRMALEAKSKLYDKLSQSSAADDEGRFLVDFQQKSLTGETSSAALPPEENEEHHSSDEYDKTSDPEEDWVDYVDCLGRTRRCLRKDLPYIKENDLRLFESLGGFDDKNKPTTTATSSTITTAEGEPQLLSSDMRRELLRQKWEEQEEQLRNKSDIHYQDVLFDEARSHGVGYYGFSQDEAERRAQQEALTKLRQETHREQEASKGLRERRQQQLQARIKAARQRKRARMGLPPEEDEPEAPASAEVEPETTESQKQEESEPKPNPEPPKKTQIRPWDIGKEGVKDVGEI
ncbi:coiled-coil domain-containing protein 174 isoform X2 [Periplaneta americana]|uniref:coiled-coil domain-containing protein 174 isoform X2 n=1 Tax=Periplaneta americana TaxID=6978 RepID=UPI0037E703B1